MVRMTFLISNVTNTVKNIIIQFFGITFHETIDNDKTSDILEESFSLSKNLEHMNR
jgi:hypothetical protein